MSQKVTAGRDNLGELAPQFAALNDDMLFGEVWAREAELSPCDRSLATVSTLIGAGILDRSLKAHLQKALDNGVERSELVEVITQLGFYAGWPKAWAAFRLLKEILAEAE